MKEFRILFPQFLFFIVYNNHYSDSDKFGHSTFERSKCQPFLNFTVRNFNPHPDLKEFSNQRQSK